LGEIAPVIVFTSNIFVSAETTLLCAGVAMTQSVVIKKSAK